MEKTQKPSQALPALVNVFCPSLGQLIQGRVLAWLLWFIALLTSAVLMLALVGFLTTPILWVLCIIDAARWYPGKSLFD